ncbi:unnamed protein product [marine sediment metagenome]|uniref:Uncharacterized protein n=1 Tax=marine sediment metagenome TaxID=412755 RepID=X1DAA4_9ZZZZ
MGDRTLHGTINKAENRYLAQRKPQHFFRKFQGFGISVTEVMACESAGIDNIVIMYIGTLGTYFYKVAIEKLKDFQRYNFNGDEQIILRIKDMEKTDKI